MLIEGNIPCLKELFVKWRTVFRSKGEGSWISACSIQEARAGDFLCYLLIVCLYLRFINESCLMKEHGFTFLL